MATATAEKIVTLDACFGTYPHTAPLKNGAITSDRVAFRFNEVEPINKAFLMMVRQEKFDVSEMALATYLQAKAYGKPLTLLPATMMGRFQHGTMFYNSERGAVTPEALPGRRVGVRAFSQTTGVWLRGILWKDYGLDLGTVKWVTFEDAHVPEYRDPPGVERAAPGKDMTKMLLDGELDAAIFGGNIPSDPRLKSVIARRRRQRNGTRNTRPCRSITWSWSRAHSPNPIPARCGKSSECCRPAKKRQACQSLTLSIR